MRLNQVPIEGIPYDRLKVEKIPAVPAYAPRDPELVPAAGRTLVINPDRICMPIGAMWAVLGVHRAIPFIQGAQGCATYARYTFSRMLFDISDTLDAPLAPPQEIPYYPPGGTTLQEIRGMGNALATFALQPAAGASGTHSLERQARALAVVGPTPVGVESTDPCCRT